MIRRLIICIFLTSMALAQTPKKQKPATTPAAAPTATPTPQATPPSLLKRDEKPVELPPDAPVVSVQGLCPAETTPAISNTVPSTKDCTITVTKQQFDNLMKSFNPNNQIVTEAQKRNLGKTYVD